MFLIFILPFAVKNDPYAYEWVVYRAAHKLPNLGLLMPPNYWEDVERRKNLNLWANAPDILKRFSYELPTASSFEQHPKFPLSYQTLNGLRRKLIGPGLTWAHTILERVPELESEIRNAIDAAGEVEAIFLWANCASMKAVAREKGFPLIHHELGPLRPPYFRFTAYFDLEGVNGQTDAERRWKCFERENGDVPILSREELLQMLSLDQRQTVTATTHEVGVALQIPDDSNILAFGRGFDSYEAISTSIRYFSGRPLVRSHPGCIQRFSALSADWDESEHPWQFLDRVEAVVTINSSMAFEAMLLGKPTYVLGDSPFKYASWDIINQTPVLSESEMLRWLNWFVFGYLIPYESTFDEGYCRWRIAGPSEVEIYLDNFKRWTETP